MNSLNRKMDDATSLHTSRGWPKCGRQGMKKGQSHIHRKAGIRWTLLFNGEAIAIWKPKVFITYSWTGIQGYCMWLNKEDNYYIQISNQWLYMTEQGGVPSCRKSSLQLETSEGESKSGHFLGTLANIYTWTRGRLCHLRASTSEGSEVSTWPYTFPQDFIYSLW